jgi:AcrR family transcriptional regulator
VPERSPRSRAGNAMGRTRAAALDGARRVLAERGVRKATMGDVAVRGGLAKATLYNHFRTKDDLVAGLVHDEVTELAADCRDLAADDLGVALTRAADAVATHPVLVGLRAVEPAALVAALAPGDGVGWDLVRAQVALVLDAGGRSGATEHVDLVCRWLASHVVAPGTQDTRAAQARLVAGAVPAAVRTTSFAVPGA